MTCTNFCEQISMVCNAADTLDPPAFDVDLRIYRCIVTTVSLSVRQIVRSSVRERVDGQVRGMFNTTIWRDSVWEELFRIRPTYRSFVRRSL